MRDRRVLGLSLAVLVLAGTGISAAVTRAGEVKTVAAVAIPDEPAASSLTTPSTTVATTTSAPPATSSMPPPTTAVPAPTSTATTAPAPTTRVTVRLTTTTSPATTVMIVPRCSPAQLAATITTDRQGYGPNDAVTASSSLRNASAAACAYRDFTVIFTFRDLAGDALARGDVVGGSTADVLLPPGEAITHAVPWNHIFYPAGVYRVEAAWSVDANTAAASVAFALT